jgi:hypothetical protein
LELVFEPPNFSGKPIYEKISAQLLVSRMSIRL